jgi:hypothetical protein
MIKILIIKVRKVKKNNNKNLFINKMDIDNVLLIIWVILSSIILGVSIWGFSISITNKKDIEKIKTFVKYVEQ